MRYGKAQITISDLWDGISKDSELFIINGHIYKKLQLQEILELSVHAMIIQVQPDLNKQIKFTVKSDGIQNPDFYTTFDETYQVYSSSVGDVVTYTFSDTNVKTLYMTGRIGFELAENNPLVDVIQWGDSNKLCYFSKFFKNFSKKSILAYDTPDIQFVSTLFQTFYASNISFDMNSLNTENIMSLNQAYRYSNSPNLAFQYPTFKNVVNLDQAFSEITNAAINWDGLKFLKLISSSETFNNSYINGDIKNCIFGSDDILNTNYIGSKLFKGLHLNGTLSQTYVNSSYVDSLFENASIKYLNMANIYLRGVSNGNRMFYNYSSNELRLNNSFYFKSYATTQEMFKLLNISGIFEFKNFTFGTSQYCYEMFSAMNYGSATLYNIDFKNAVLDFLFKESVYNPNPKNIKVSLLKTSLCTSFISMFENNDNILIHNPELINIDMKKATNISSIFKGCKTFDFKNFYVTTTTFPEVVNAESMFEDCANMQANITNMRLPKLKYGNRMFRNCSLFNQPLNLLNAPLLEQADYMLENCYSYNSPTIMSQNIISAIGMLKNCTSFNQNITFNFNHNVETFAKELFYGCVSFNPTSTVILDLHTCKDGTSIFDNCNSFNQSVSLTTDIMTVFDFMFKGTCIDSSKTINIVTNNALSMKGIFAYTLNFGADISCFYTPNVTDFSYICYSSYNFTSNLSFIETDNCLTLAYGFASSNYNSTGLLNWNVAKVTNYLSCFENSSFNQPLNWVTSAGQIYTSMFKKNIAFNQLLSNFDFTEALNVSNMFLNAVSFNQDWSAKRFNKCIIFDFMFYGADAYQNKVMSSWLVNSVKTGISHIGFLKNNTTNTEPVWK